MTSDSKAVSASRISDLVAECALTHYQKKIRKGKPKDGTEWTVYAAIVAQREDRMWVTSASTGTKCTAHRQDGYVLHDGHAEVLARRGLLRVLWLELREKLEKSADGFKVSSTDVSLLENHTEQHRFKLRFDTSLHLYISDSPCGDASIYETTFGPLFTGAKVVVSSETGITSNACGGDHQLLNGTPVAREDTQLLGKLRAKSGRSNLPAHLRSSSMSCSDKIVKWCILGLQGSLLSQYLDPVLLSTVIVSRDPRGLPSSTPSLVDQVGALERAIPERIQGVWDDIATTLKDEEVGEKWQWANRVPSVSLVPQMFAAAKSVRAPNLGQMSSNADDKEANTTTNDLRKRKRGRDSTKKVSPCGFALNWQQSSPDAVEIVVGARGICQGKKPQSVEDYRKLSSRLSRQSLYQEGRVMLATKASSYLGIKSEVTNENWKALKALLLQIGPLSGWLQGQSDFSLT